MPWVGVAESVSAERALELLEGLGLSVRGEVSVVEIKTSRGWVKFRVFEVEGDVEGTSLALAERTDAPALESGPHIIFGEVSAGLWDEGARVHFPDGHSEVVAIFTYDGFLDVRMPTSNVRGLKPSMVVGGRVYELPLKLSDLLEIARIEKKALEKVEKAASAYGLERVMSRGALEGLRRREVSAEVDYEAGFVMVREGDRARVISLREHFLNLILKGLVDKAKEVFEGAPEEVRGKLSSALREEYEVRKGLEDEKGAKLLQGAAEKLGVKLYEGTGLA